MKQYFMLIFLVVFISCNQEKYDQKIQEDVTFLANDKLEGRATGSEGEKIASEYIANRFKDLGLNPKGTNGFLQPFSFTPKVILKLPLLNRYEFP